MTAASIVGAFVSYLLVFHLGLGALYTWLGVKLEGFDPKRGADEQDGVLGACGEYTLMAGAFVQILVVPILAGHGARRLLASAVRRPS